MSLVAIIMDSDDNKVKVNWFYIRKLFSAQSEEISSCIYYLKLVTNTVLIATMFLS